jgi:hypothetical protein
MRKRDWVMEVQSVFVLYDAQQRVERIARHVGCVNGHSGFQREWQAGRWFTPDNVDKVKRNVTTGADLTHWFGPATVEGLDVRGRKVLSWISYRGHANMVISAQEFIAALDSDSVVTEFVLRDLRP